MPYLQYRLHHVTVWTVARVAWLWTSLMRVTTESLHMLCCGVSLLHPFPIYKPSHPCVYFAHLQKYQEQGFIVKTTIFHQFEVLDIEWRLGGQHLYIWRKHLEPAHHAIPALTTSINRNFFYSRWMPTYSCNRSLPCLSFWHYWLSLTYTQLSNCSGPSLSLIFWTLAYLGTHFCSYLLSLILPHSDSYKSASVKSIQECPEGIVCLRWNKSNKQNVFLLMLSAKSLSTFPYVKGRSNIWTVSFFFFWTSDIIM